jgi:hypothetical protein
MKTAAPTTGKGRLRAIGAAFQARALAEQTAAKARFTASLPGAKAAPTEARSVAATTPQQSAPVPSTMVVASIATATSTAAPAPTTPPAAPSGADLADLEILTRYKAMVGTAAITFFLQHERAILRARAGVPSDMGKHKALHGIDRVTAAMRVPSS